MKTKLLLFVLVAFMVASCSKKKEVTSGNIVIEIPINYKVETNSLNQVSDFMSGLLAADKDLSHVYFLYELKMKSEPDYILEFSVKGAIRNVTSSSQWEESEKTKFLSYDAYKCKFTATFQGKDMNGIAYAFNDGKSRSYGVVAMYKGAVPSEDPVLNSFHLTKNTDPEVSYKNAGEEMQHFVEQIRPVFGQDTNSGYTIHDIEVYPEKKELIYTMGITVMSKSDLSPSELAEAQAASNSNMSIAIKEMAKSQPPLLRCMGEGYNITINIVDKNKEHLFTSTLSPEDYQ